MANASWIYHSYEIGEPKTRLALNACARASLWRAVARTFPAQGRKIHQEEKVFMGELP